MSRRDQLLADVVASPDDDAPRRIYADWLIGSGGDPARGELIHAQCDLAAIDTETDDLATRDRLWDLRKRERALWGAHWHRWQTEADLGDPYRVEFQRGFPVACDVENVAAWRRVVASTVRKVRVRPTVALRAPGPLRIHSVILRTGYYFEDGDFADERRAKTLAEVATTGVFPALRRLELEHRTCTSTATRAFGAAWSRTLEGFKAHMNRQSVVALLEKGQLGGLRELTIFGKSAIDLAKGLVEANHLSELRSLMMGIDEGMLRVLSRWEGAPLLEKVWASLPTASAVQEFLELPMCTRLRELGTNLPLTDPGIRDVVRGGRLAALRSVRLKARGLSNIDLSPFPELRDLWLDIDKIDVLRRLASPTLRKLDLFTEWHIPRVMDELAQARLPALEEVSAMERYPEDYSDKIPLHVRRAMPRLRRAVAA